MNIIDKGAFVCALARKGYTKKDAEVVVNDFLATLQETLLEEGGVRFHGFGCFEVRPRKGRTIKPVCGGPAMVGEDSKVVKFTAGNALYRVINESEN